MGSVVADTHALIWYLQRSPKLSPRAAQSMVEAHNSGFRVLIPSITVVEIIYLVDKGRFDAKGLEEILAELTDPDSHFGIVPLDFGVSTAMRNIPLSAVPDMPDRIIAATASHLGLPLVTCDRKIQLAGIETIW